MKLSLRSKLLLPILPLLAVLAFLLFTALLPYQRVKTDINNLRPDVPKTVALGDLGIALSRQMTEYYKLILSGGAEDRFQSARTNTQQSLERLRKEMAIHTGSEQDAEASQAVAEIAGQYAELNRLCQSGLELAKSGQQDKALDLIKTKVEPLLEDSLRMKFEQLDAENGIEFEKDLARLRGHSDGLLTFSRGDLQSDIKNMKGHITDTLLVDTVARNFNRQMDEYYFLVLAQSGEVDEIETARKAAFQALESWKINEGGGVGQRDTANKDLEDVENVERELIKLNQLADSIPDLARGGQTAQALHLLNNEIEPIAQGKLAEILDESVRHEGQALAESLDKINKSSSRMQFGLGAFSLLVLVIGLGTPWLLSKTIISPILELNSAASKVGSGDLDTKVSVTSKGELSQLATTFNQMTEALKESRDSLHEAKRELEQKVSDRTVELRDSNQQLQVELVERKQMEAALRESERKYRDLFENANDIIYTHDLQGNYTSLNKACEKIVGYTSEEALRMNLTQVIAPECLDEARQLLARKTGETTPTAYELEIIAKDGHRITLEVNSRLTYEDGKPAGVQSMARDITERKRAEEALKASETRFQSAFDHAPTGIVLVTPAGRFLQVNKSFCGMLGYTEEELLALDVPSITQPDDRAATREILRQALAGEFVTAQIEKRYLHKLGHEVSSITSLSLVRDNQAKPLYIIAQTQDITKRKRVEAERQAITDIVQGVITTSNLDELFTLAQQAIGKLLSAENCFVALYDKTSDLIRVPFCKDEFDAVASPQKLGKGLTAFVLRSGRPMLLTPELIQELVSKGEIELVGTLPAAWLGVPLRTSTDIIGVLVVQHYEDKDAYGQQDLELLALVGDQLALAIQRKQIEIELRTNEIQLTEAQHIANLGSWEWDVLTDKVRWSDELFGIFGLQPQESGATFDTFLTFVHPDDRKIAESAIAQAFQDRVFPQYEYRITRPDGTVRVLQSNGRVTDDETGRTIKMVGTVLDITERKRAEEGLRESEERYRLLFESNPQPMWVYDLETLAFLAVNESAVHHYGYSREDFLAMTIKDIRPAEDIPALCASVNRPCNKFEAAGIWRHLKKDGTIIEVEITSHLLLFDDRRAELILAHDITERRRAEAERQVITEIVQGVLTTSNLDELFTLAHQAISKLLSAENCFVALYDKTSDLIRVPFCKDEFDAVASPQKLGKGLTAFVLRSGRPMLLTPELIQELVSKGEIELVGTLPAAWLGVPLRTSTDIIGVLVVQHYEDKDAYSQQDVELLASVADQLGLAIERKQNEIVLKTNEMQLSAAQQIAHIGSWEWDNVNKKLHWSEELFRIFGLPPREVDVTFKNYFGHVHPDDRKLVMRSIKQVLRGGEFPEFDYRVIRPDGSVRTLQVNCKGIADATGVVTRIWGTTQDITERKRAEKERDVISEVIQSVNLTSNLDELLTQVHQSLKRVLYAENCCVLLYDKQTGLFEAPLFVDLFEANPFPMALSRSFIARVFSSRQPLLMNEAIFRGLLDRGEVELIGRPAPSFLAVPLMTPAETIGVIVVQHYEKDNVYSQRDVEFLSAVAAQLALAIERKRAEAALAKSEKRYRELIDFGQGLICTHDLDGKLLSVNPAAAESLGYTPAEMEGRNLIEYVSPSAQPVFPHYLKRIAAEPHLSGLLNLLTRKGEERIWMYRNSRIAEPGEIAYVLGFAQDVTDSKRAEEALVESERRFRDLFYDAPVGYHELDTEGRITCVNTTELSMLGYSEAEMIGHHVWEFIEEAEIARKTFAEKLAGNKPTRNVERSFRRKDGTFMAVQLDDQMLNDPSGRIIGIRATMQDITERTQAEEALKQSEERYRTIIEDMTDSYSETDLAGKFTFLNNQAAIGQRRSREELIGLSNKQYMDEETVQRVGAAYKQVYLTGEPVKGLTFEMTRGDGTTYYVESNVSLIRDSQGKPVGFRGISRDVTERKQIEAQLVEARDVALESARLKSEFLANMSHEIRTPMNGVIGMTGLLLDTDLDEEQRNCAETIRGSGEALLTIINDILDFSKMEAGKLQFETLDFLLHNAVEDTIELLAGRAHQKKIEFASLIHSDVPTDLRGDPGRLRQVLTNLIGNAIKFTERGEVIVRAEKESETKDDVVVRFMISDTGIGISEAAQEHLFQAFTQADGSTTRKYGGTGLGLAISKQLVELMGGQMGVTSTPGQGSTFWFTARFGKQLAGAAVPRTRLISLEKLRVLIVDDNATNRKILSHQLGSWGMIHQEADSGFHALELLRSAAAEGVPYDLAVLDLMMPGMDGFELARTIKSDPSIAGMHLVMLTSFGERGDGSTAREVGVAAYLTKPVRQSHLFDCLANVIGAATVTSEPDVASAKPGPQLLTKHKLKESRMSSNKLILLAEDNVVNQKVAIRQLQKLGYRADAVANGREAIEALGRIRYDLILMDCQMPEMDGYEATAEIRRQEGTMRHTPIVAMTAHALTGDREKCIAAGMDEYVPKPVKPEELKRVLEHFFKTPGTDPVDQAGLATAPLVDVDRMHEMMGDEPVEFQEIANLYLDQMGKNLHQLDAAVASGNHVEIELIAHNCAGTSANCGMNAVAIPFRELETVGRTGSLENAPASLAQAHKLFEQTRVCLIQHIAQAVS